MDRYAPGPQEARNERVVTPLNIDQALDARDAISKVLYSSLFSWLVRRVNQIVFRGARKMSISILDIFGFEDFKVGPGYAELIMSSRQSGALPRPFHQRRAC